MHYLDYAATTPMLDEVVDVMTPLYRGDFGNPSSVHAYGRNARRAIEDARDRVSDAIGASPAEIVFTGGGTEADNLAIKGAAAKLQASGRHVVVTAFEHHAVLDPALYLRKQGFDVTVLPVPASGVVVPSDVADAVRNDTILVSVMAVNNEIGTIQPIAAVTESVKAQNHNTIVHTDAVQALGNIPVDVHLWGMDLASFAAHKLGGPKGVGCLFVRAHVPLEPLLHGGGQERGIRSGTMNVPGIAGFGIAAEIAAKEVHAKHDRLLELRARLLDGLRQTVPDIVVNGDLDRRVANNLNVCIPRADGETLILLLDEAGIACSSGSACASGAMDPSHVLLAIGTSHDLAKGSLRFSFGRDSTSDDVEAVLEVFPAVVDRARRVA